MQPCVGIWISGILSLQDSHLWAACMDFLLSRLDMEKALQSDMAFLVIAFMPGAVPPIVSALAAMMYCKHQGTQAHDPSSCLDSCMACLPLLQAARWSMKLLHSCLTTSACLCGHFQPEQSMHRVEHLLLCASVSPSFGQMA